MSRAAQGLNQLQLSVTCVDRLSLPDGNEFIKVMGVVTNPTASIVPVPPLDAFVVTASGQVIHQWTIVPPMNVLAPHASETFGSSESDVPPGGGDLTITLRTALPPAPL
jgi:hypothetical protein